MVHAINEHLLIISSYYKHVDPEKLSALVEWYAFKGTVCMCTFYEAGVTIHPFILILLRNVKLKFLMPLPDSVVAPLFHNVCIVQIFESQACMPFNSMLESYFCKEKKQAISWQ